MINDDKQITSSFTPLCFEKEIEKVFKNKSQKQKSLFKGRGNNIIYERKTKNSIIYTTTMISEASGESLLEQLKKFKLLKNWCPYVSDTRSIMNIDKNCDAIELDINFLSPGTIFSFLKSKLKIIRFWCFDSTENTHIFLIKPLEQNNYKSLSKFIFKFNLVRAGFIIKINPYDKKRSLVEFNIKVTRANILFDTINRNICLEICSSLNSFLQMEKINRSLSEMNMIPYSKKLKADADTDAIASISGYKFLINYFINLELPSYQEEKNPNYEDSKYFKYLLLKFKGVNDIQSVNSIQNYTRRMTNFAADVSLMKSYYEVKNEMSSIYSDNYFSDGDIMRYVYGLQGDTNKIIAALIELEKFRKTLKKNEIKQEEFDLIEYQWSLFCKILCLDNFMRPVIMIRLHYLKYIPNKQFCEKIIRYLLFIFNKAIFLMPANVDKYVVIVDCKNSSLENIPDEYINKLAEIFKNYYVERLANLFIIKKGIMFPMIWNTVCRYLDKAHMLEKISVLKDYKEELCQLIPEDAINYI